LNSTVVTPAAIIMSNARFRQNPGPAEAQNSAANPATNSSATTPAEATAMRRHRSRNAQLEVTSTYGSGLKKSNIRPSVCTSPPKWLCRRRHGEFVQRLHQHDAQVKQHEIGGGEHIARRRSQFGAVVNARLQRPSDHAAPDNGGPRPEQPAQNRFGPIQGRIRIQQRKARKHQVRPREQPFALFALPIAGEELLAVRGHLVVEQIGVIQLGEKLNHILLPGRAVRIVIQRLLPGILDGPVRPEPAMNA